MKTPESATVIGRSATFRGELTGSAEILIEGTVEGTVQATGGRLTVGKEAKVRADLSAQEVIIFGRVEGNVRATERVDLRSTAVVIGDLFAKRIAIEEDAVLRGRVDPNRAAEPMTPLPVTPVPATPAYRAPVETPAPFAPIVMQQPVATPAPMLFAERSAQPLERSAQPFGRSEGRMPSALAMAAERAMTADRSTGAGGLGALSEANSGESADEIARESHE